MTRPQPSVRADYPFFTRLHTRWDDNDIYGHLNNTVHYKLMDTAVNGWLLDHVGLDYVLSPAVENHRLVVFRRAAFGGANETGAEIGKIGPHYLGGGDIAACRHRP